MDRHPMRIDDRDRLEAVGREVIDASICVHRTLGPGLLESAYEKALAIELRRRGISCFRQVDVEGFYEGESPGVAFRADLVVEQSIVVELKSVEQIVPLHHAQLRTYLRLMDLRLGFVINFNVKLLKDGIKRVVNRI